MANPKRWPIGLQSSTTGDPKGIGEIIQELSRNNIAFFSASSDSTSILGDLQAARERYPDVPHTGNYIPTGYWPDESGYHLSVPRYGQKPGPEMAAEHWDMVEAKSKINDPNRSPINWEIPCLWISTWNEVRPYTGWARLATEEPEDPVEGYAGNADLIGEQAYYIGLEALERRYRWAAFGFAGGDPQEDFWDVPGVLKYLRLCAEHPDHLGIALHEYSHILWLDVPDKIGRFKLLHDACDRHNIRRPVIQIKEFGWEATDIPDRDEAMRQLLPVAEMYMEHPNIHGAAIWTVQSWQGSGIKNKVRDLIPLLGEAALRHAKEIPPQQPVVVSVIEPQPEPQPVPVVEPQPAAPGPKGAWPFMILKDSVEEAAKKLRAATEEFGIDVSRWQVDRLNWGQLKKDGVQFAFIRVGSGKKRLDDNYNRNVYGCIQAGIPFGNYFYLYEDVDVKQQARMFVQQGDWRSTLPPAVDVEQWGLTAEQMKTFVDEFHRLVESPPIVIYTRANLWNAIVPKQHEWPSNHPLWVAHYETDTPDLPHHWDRWIFFQPGLKRGLAGYPKQHPDQSDALDYDHFNGPLPELFELASPVKVLSVAFDDYLPFDSPVGSAAQRRRREPMFPGDWLDANPFANKYTNPSTHKVSFHTGNDLNRPGDADANATIHAAADGKVTFAGQLNVWGNVIVIKHGPNLFSRYGHVREMRVKEGDVVERGDLIAQVGQDAFGGPFHLHFDISPTDILESKPWHWPGENMEELLRHYVDPKDYIDRHRQQDTDPPPAPRLPVPDKFGYVTAPIGLNFRLEPSSAGGKATIIKPLPHGTKVGVYERVDGWYHVRVEDMDGYVSADYIALETPEPAPGTGTPTEPPKTRTRSVVGVHGAPGAAAPPEHTWDMWTNYLKEMGVAWYKQCDSADENIFRWAVHLKNNGIEPIIRHLQSQQFPNNLEERHFQQMKRYAEQGIHWAEIGNEPNLGYEWQESWWKDEPPRMRWSNPESIEILAQRWIEDAAKAVQMGAWPAFYAFGPTDWGEYRPNHVFSSTVFTDKVVERLATHHRAQTNKLFKEDHAWISVHVAKYEKDFDFDPYAENKNKPWDMALRGYELVLNAFRKHFGNDLDVDSIPIISTEGGVFVPDHSNWGVQAWRLPVDDEAHGRETVEMFEYVDRATPLTAMCPWCISEGSLIGHSTDMFRHHGWFKQENGHLHERPVYQKMKALYASKTLAKEVALEALAKEVVLPPAVETTPAAAETKTTVTITLKVKVEVCGGSGDVEVKVDPGIEVE